MLFIGMGTEVIVFFLSGFERPWRDDGVEEVQQSAIQNLAIETIPEEGHEEEDDEDDENNSTSATNTSQKAGQLAAAVSTIQVHEVQGMTPEMAEATKNYVEQLNQLTETLKQVSEQSARLTRDS